MNAKELESIASQMSYKTYFEQKEILGKGGYAQVFKVVNRMDKNQYAMKIIQVKLRDIRNNLETELKKITRESRHLASLTHPSIIRYYNSWVEVGKKRKEKKPKKSKLQKREDAQKSSSDEKNQLFEMVFDGTEDDNDDDNITFFQEIVEQAQPNTGEEDVLFLNKKTRSSSPVKGLSKKLEIKSEKKKSSFVQEKQQQPQQQVQQSQQTIARRNSLSQLEDRQSFEDYEDIVFYIQTELCDNTLDKYLQERNKKLFQEGIEEDGVQQRLIWEESYDILQQILEGLDYVHNVCKLVHRDLKPQNIFLKGNQVKIGDFGLVKKINKLIINDQSSVDSQFMLRHKKLSCDIKHFVQSQEKSTTTAKLAPKEQPKGLPFYLPNGDDDLMITKNCGTAIYASPEQLNADFEAFDQRADIFSLGIIMLQVLNPTVTQMEHLSSIKECKKNLKIPKYVLNKHQHLASMIVDCLQADPKFRPSIKMIEDALRKDRLKNKMYMKRKRSNETQSFKCSYRMESQEDVQTNKHLKILESELYVFHEHQEKAEVVYNLKECEVAVSINPAMISVRHHLMKDCSLYLENVSDIDKVQVLINEVLGLNEQLQLNACLKTHQETLEDDNSEWTMQIVE